MNISFIYIYIYIYIYNKPLFSLVWLSILAGYLMLSCPCKRTVVVVFKP